MPWCEDCEKYWAPSAMTPEGECPDCGTDLEPPEGAAGDRADDEERAPWHFKLLVVMLIAYLVYRGYEMFT
jgi:hypothetical protein